MVALLIILLANPVLPPPTPGSALRHADLRAQTCTTCHPQALTSDRVGDRLRQQGADLIRVQGVADLGAGQTGAGDAELLGDHIPWERTGAAQLDQPRRRIGAEGVQLVPGE